MTTKISLGIGQNAMMITSGNHWIQSMVEYCNWFVIWRIRKNFDLIAMLNQEWSIDWKESGSILVDKSFPKWLEMALNETGFDCKPTGNWRNPNIQEILKDYQIYSKLFRTKLDSIATRSRLYNDLKKIESNPKMVKFTQEIQNQNGYCSWIPKWS